MKTTTELARETAAEFFGTRNGTLESIIQSALDAQAAQYREVIKAATDASSKLRRELSPEIHLWPEYQDFADAMDALVYISELTPKV